MQKRWVQSLGWEDLPVKEMATYSSILAWEIPWKEEPGGLQSMGLPEWTEEQWLMMSKNLSLLAIYTSLKNCLLKSFAHFSFELLVFLLVLLSCKSLCIFWSDSFQICKYFFTFYRLSFYLLAGITCSTNVFNFNEVQFIFSFVTCAFSIVSKKPLSNSKSWRFTPKFSSKIFIFYI